MADNTIIAFSETRSARDFTLEPDADARAALAERLDVPKIRKLRFAGRIAPLGEADWRLEATLGATVVQTCVVTLDPVTTRIDEAVGRTYRAHMPEPEDGSETEMPEDEEEEPLPTRLDLAEVMAESLALALPDFPRADGVEIGDAQFTEPGKTAMTDDDAKPFAGLAALKASMSDEKDD